MLQGVVPGAEEGQRDHDDRRRHPIVPRQHGGEPAGDGHRDAPPSAIPSAIALTHLGCTSSTWTRMSMDLRHFCCVYATDDGCAHVATCGVAGSPRRGSPPLGAEQDRVRRAGRGRSHDALATAVAGEPACPRLDTVFALAAAHDLSIDWLVGLSNIGPVEAELICSTHRSKRRDRRRPTSGSWLADRGRRLQDPLRPGHAARPAEVRRRDPLRAFTVGGPGRRPDASTPRRRAWRGRATRTPRWSAARRCRRSRRSPAARACGAGSASRPPRPARPHDPARRRALPDVPLVPVRQPAPVRRTGHGVRRQRAALYLGQLYLVLTSSSTCAP